MATRIKLTWDDNNVAETGHNIYRSDTPMDPEALPTALATLAADVVEYFDETVTEGQTYYYRVGAFNGAEELVSGEVTVVALGDLWTPLNMAVVPQIYLDAQDSVVTDVSGFASAISNLGAMGASGDFVQGNADSRPAILAAELNGKRVLRFDGLNDVLLGDTAQQKDILRNTGAGWSFEVIKKRTIDPSGGPNRFVFDCRNGTGAQRMITHAGNPTAGNENKPLMLVRRADGGSLGALVSPETSASYQMRLFHMSYSSGRGDIYIDGALSVSNVSLTDAGNTSNTASTVSIKIGGFGASSAADIDMVAIIIDRIELSAGDIDRLFGWAAHKYGLTANLPGDHPYKSVAPGV